MCGQERDSFLLQEGSLGTVAVMRVIVDDGDPVESTCKCIPRRDRYVIEDTKSHGAIRFCVMPGRTHDREGVICISIQNRPGAGNNPPGSLQRILERGPGYIRGRVVDN